MLSQVHCNIRPAVVTTTARRRYASFFSLLLLLLLPWLKLRPGRYVAMAPHSQPLKPHSPSPADQPGSRPGWRPAIFIASVHGRERACSRAWHYRSQSLCAVSELQSLTTQHPWIYTAPTSRVSREQSDEDSVNSKRFFFQDFRPSVPSALEIF